MGQVTFKLEGDEAKAVQAFLKVVDVQKKAEQGLDRMGRKGKQTGTAFSRMSKGMTGELRGMAMQFVGIGAAIGGIRAAWRLYQKDIADSVNSMKEFQSEFVNLQFLGDFYKDPKLRKKAHELAKLTGIPAREISKGIWTLQSMTDYATPKQRAGMLTELIKLRQTGSTPLPELIPTFAKMGGIYKGISAREQANLTQYLIEKAAVSTPQEVAAEAPKAFAAGLVGDMKAPTAAAMYAFMTAKTGTAALASTGMKMLVRKVMLAEPGEAEAMRTLAFGAKSPMAGKKSLMAQAKIAEGDNAYQRLLKLAELNKRRKLSTQDLKDLFGERGLEYGKIMLGDPEGLKKLVGEFRAKTGPGVDIAGTKIRRVLKDDPIYRRILAGTRAQAGIEAARQRPENLIWDNLSKSLEQIRLDTGGQILFRTTAWMRTQQAKIRTEHPTWSPLYQTPEEAATGTLVGALQAEKGMSSEQATQTARRMLGIDASPVLDNLNKATENLLNASNNLRDASRRTANVNAHVESSEFGNN